MKYFFTFISLILLVSFYLFSCRNPPEDNKDQQPSQETSSKLYGNTNFIFPKLTAEAKLEVSHWGAFEDFNIESKSINGNNIEALKIKTGQLVSHIDSLNKKIPDTLNTRAISSRVIVVKTRAQILEQELNKSRIDSIKIQNYLNEMNISVKNLIIQINEKFQKDAIDLQRIDNEKQELKQQQHFLDSVYKSELQDQRR